MSRRSGLMVPHSAAHMAGVAEVAVVAVEAVHAAVVVVAVVEAAILPMGTHHGTSRHSSVAEMSCTQCMITSVIGLGALTKQHAHHNMHTITSY